jgi:16S rRNA processing protein RimM
LLDRPVKPGGDNREVAGRRTAMAERVLVAQIGAAHGIRGEVRLRAFTADPLAVKDYGPLETEDGAQTLTIETLRPQKDVLVVRFAGITDRNAAERLRNQNLYVARARLPATEADEFYHTDLIGLKVEAADGRALGTVIAVHNFGAGDLIEVKPPDGPAVMLPFTESAVPLVDVAGGRIVVAQWDNAASSGSSGAQHRPSRDPAPPDVRK